MSFCKIIFLGFVAKLTSTKIIFPWDYSRIYHRPKSFSLGIFVKMSWAKIIFPGDYSRKYHRPKSFSLGNIRAQTPRFNTCPSFWEPKKKTENRDKRERGKRGKKRNNYSTSLTIFWPPRNIGQGEDGVSTNPPQQKPVRRNGL